MNVSKEPFEWTCDSRIYGPLQPGEMREVPDHVGAHGVNRSMILDDIGEPTGQYRLKPVNAVQGSPEFERMVKYPCSMCQAGPFGKSDLERHMMETHFAKPAVPATPSQGSGQDRTGGTQSPRFRPKDDYK